VSVCVCLHPVSYLLEWQCQSQEGSFLLFSLNFSRSKEEMAAITRITMHKHTHRKNVEKVVKV